MSRCHDALLFALLGLLATSLLGFFLDVIPYPFGLFVLTAFIVARILYLQGPNRPGH